MVDAAKRSEILNKLAEGVLKFDEEGVKQAAQEAVDVGVDAYEAIMDGLAAGMEEAGRLYDEEEYFVPELLLCADALYAGLDILRPHVEMDESTQAKGHIVIGTVEGDVHDIGKNMVKMMFEVGGFKVHDLSRDVKLEKFIEEQLKTDAEIVCMSAMMTTSMMGMKRAVEMIREKAPHAKVMIGGAPVTDEIVKRFGADTTADSASTALGEALNMISALREMKKA